MKSPYKTRQQDALLAYLESVKGSHFTASDVCEHFRRTGSALGTATVYRQLEKMVDAGIMTKYSIDAGSPACFEYLGQAHAAEQVCYHCKCEKCGRLVHMHCDALPELEKHILDSHGFAVDPLRTVFYGLCQSCREGA